MHRLHFFLERQQVDRAVPRAYKLELVQNLLGNPLCVERRNPLRNWRDPDVYDDTDNETVGLAFGRVVDFPVINLCLAYSLLLAAVQGRVFSFFGVRRINTWARRLGKILSVLGSVCGVVVDQPHHVVLGPNAVVTGGVKLLVVAS